MNDHLPRKTLNRVTYAHITTSAHKIWQKHPSIADKISSEASQIILQTQESAASFLAGKSTKGIIGGLLYLLGFRYNNSITQVEIARKLKTNAVTIRLSYRTWLKHFPDSFNDVVEKMKECSFLHDFSLYKKTESH